MSHLQPAPTVLSRGLRYETPDSSAQTQGSALPSPPPRPRLRLKRRNVSSQLNPPTQQFLASVAAADVPIPSVEEPQFATIDHEMMDNLPQVQVRDFDDMDIYQSLHSRRFSPPKTPAPALDIQAALAPTKYPDWTVDSDWSSDMDSASDCESSRPSTAFSTQTSASLFSRFSVLSDDEYLSPEPDTEASAKPSTSHEAGAPPKKTRKAPWTKAMTAHLWSTYMLYLQDPKVTPLRLGKSGIPPHGVCLRVAREAKRSWKGSNPRSMPPADKQNATPTAESSKPFVKWPHTYAATRACLRELCRANATAKVGRRHLMSRSPTPFNKVAHRRWNRRTTPGRSPSIFSGNDMAMSLTLSTSDTMQPHGPLAQLAQSPLEPFPELIPSANLVADAPAPESSAPELARLGSPFAANSYGPSSSTSLAADLNLPKQSNSLGSRKSLKSPVRLTRSRSGTQKRKSVKAAEDQPKKRRPSVTTTFGVAAQDNKATAYQSTAASNLSDPFQAEPVADTSSTQRTRLGSPFSGSGFSHSFPNRSSTHLNFNLNALRRPFATIQQPSQRRSESPSTRSSLASRLAYLDQRLRDFRNRRRSQSPL